MDRRRKCKADGFGREETAISGNRNDDGQVVSVNQVTGADFKEKEMTSLQKYVSENGIEALVDTLEKAVDRMTPKKVVVHDGCVTKNYICPTCQTELDSTLYRFCDQCGQALDWSE